MQQLQEEGILKAMENKQRNAAEEGRLNKEWLCPL